MSTDTFQERLSRIKGPVPATPNDISPRQPPADPAPDGPRTGPGIIPLILTGLILIPLGAMARVLRPMYMEATPDWVYFNQLFAFVALTHLILILGGMIALFGFKRWPFFGKAMLMMWAGYGVGSAMMALVVT